ncbi:bifunctional P-450/NADPH-P450 reductase [Apiospora saccharicola]
MAAVTTAGCPATSFEDAGAAECPADVTTTITLAELQQKQKEAIETIDESKLLLIPKPPHQHFFGLMGHLSDLDRTLPARSYWQYMNEYAPIFQLDLGMTYPRVFVGSRELVNEMADDTRFTKFTHRLHQEMRAVFGDGLFSAESTDPAWWKAHRLPGASLGSRGIEQDIASQLVLKWDRFGAGREIELIDDMARLTFDTIGLCAYGFRFNEFYNEETHPLERQLKAAIVESGRRANRPDVMNQFYYYKDEEQRQQNIVEIRRLCREIIQDRVDNPRPEANDLLNVMIHGVDKVSGEKMGLENVIYQIPTLLGGGYETTSATLSFLWYFLCKNPHALRKAREEVDEIVGDGVLAYDMLRKLKYLDACMKETLRMQHPVTLFTRFSTRDTVLGGKYFIHKGQMVSGIWRHFHRDPKTWGNDADSFRPERMLDAEFSKMPPNAWKPFGDGLRACIGRGFAEQEMLICMAMVLQKFDIELVNPDYELELTGQMGVKPIDLKVRVRRRPDRDLTTGIPGGVRVGQSTPTPTRAQLQPAQANMNVSTAGPTANLKPIAVLYGGNQGTCESLVRSFATNAPNFGLEVASIQDMDSAIGNVPTDKPTIIVTPSYEGRPADNAAQFVAWIEKMAETGTKLPPGFKFAVFGVGNSDWVHTFHRVPKLVDEKLAEIGGERIIAAGFTNVKRDTVGPWDAWTEKLSSTLAGGGNISTKKALKDTVGVDVEIASGVLNLPEHVFEGGRMTVGVVTANRELADASVGPAKRHIEIRLPPDHQYESGDYLVVQGRNPDEIVSRVMKRFGILAGDVMRIPSSKKSFLPTQPTVVQEFLQRNVELAVRITKRQLAVLASFAEDKSVEKSRLEKMQDDTIYESLLDKRYSIIDILEEVPELDLPFGAFLDMLQCLMPRTAAPAPGQRRRGGRGGLVVALTVDVFDAPAINGHGQFRGVVSSFLADLPVDGQLPCLVRQPKLAFRLPADPATPIIMLAAGSGIAPMRAFLQERAALQQQQEQDTQLGPALLYFGCRHPDKDYLYRSELEAWQAAGLVEVIPCFSRPGDRTAGRHVPDALWADRERVWKLLHEEGARVYVCGSAARLGMSSAETWRRIWRKETGKGEMEALEWLEQMRNEQRYTSDVY